ncbi:MAG: hypothetical protein H6597_05610 [Flavobacteriales bacterium]|nr:hypothetical protein [Flavobacteriales bacterium]MCB9193991.1 hypothetical protein [Flavobacteriales bacterium]
MDQEMTPAQSMEVIHRMIAEAKQSAQRANFYFLLWGVLCALSGAIDHVLLRQGVALHWLVWPGMGLIGAIGSSLHGAREGHRKGVMTMMDRVQMWLWSGFAITLVLLIILLVAKGLDPNPFVLVLTGMPTFITGMLMRFRPLMIGGLLFWVIGLTAAFVFPGYSSLIFSAGIVVGYIIPGLMLKRHEDGLRTT